MHRIIRGKKVVSQIIILLGGIAIFIYGLKIISEVTQSSVSGGVKNRIASFTKTPIRGVLTGAAVSAITQSSVAVNVITVGLVEGGVISFFASSAVIMGANIGTTVTAQIISASAFGGGVIGAIVSIIGLLANFSKNNRIKSASEILMGLGVLFAGLSIMSKSVAHLGGYYWFQKIFLIKNPFLLFLNGMVTTGITQSSSAVTGITVLLANGGLIDFKSSAFITLGSNVGSCFAVVITSLNKSVEGRRAAVFNLAFNLFGSLLFFPVLYFFGDALTLRILSKNKSVGKAIADFHTLFNIICTVVALPILKFLTLIIEKLVKDTPKTSPKNTSRIKSFY